MSFFVPDPSWYGYANSTDDPTKKKNELYQSILEKIENYNKLSETEKITLNIEKKYKVNNVYIFVYKKQFIGIFDKNNKNYGYFYNYDNLNSDNIYNLRGYKIDLNILKKDFNINEAISFNQIREIMKASYLKLVLNYEEGYATEKEILEVIDFSFKYFEFASKTKKRTL